MQTFAGAGSNPPEAGRSGIKKVVLHRALLSRFKYSHGHFWLHKMMATTEMPNSGLPKSSQGVDVGLHLLEIFYS